MAWTTTDVQDLIGTFPVNSTNEIRISTIKNADGELKSIDIRQWFVNSDGEMSPSKKGFRFKHENISKMIGLLLMNVDMDVIQDIITDFGIDIEIPESE